MATIIKAVTLVPGEKFTLPPGSVLIGSTDINNLTSNCNIPNLEELQCFVASIGANEDNGTTSGYWEGNEARISGFRLSGSVTNFDTPYLASEGDGLIDFNLLGDELIAKLGGIITTDVNVITDGDRGVLHHFLIQTIPSIANNLQLIFKSTSPINVEPSGNTEVTTYVEFITREQAIALNYVNVPVCPTAVPET